MCLIIESKKEIPLTEAFIANVAKRNKDGFGMMWIQNNSIHTFKHHQPDLNLFWNKFREIEEFNPVIHFRMKTHGEIDTENTHPYYCGHGIWMMHNGIIHQTSRMGEGKSDTWHFINSLIKPIFAQCKNPHVLIRQPVFRYLVEDYVGTQNRLIFGDRGGFVIMNPETWHTIKDKRFFLEGLRVSNTYAWDEKDLLPKEKKKKEKKNGYENVTRQWASTWQPAKPSGQRWDADKGEWVPLEPGYNFADYRYTNYGLEEICDNYWVTDDNQIWEKLSEHKYKRRHDLTFEQVINMNIISEANKELAEKTTASTTVIIGDKSITTVNGVIVEKEADAAVEKFLQLCLPEIRPTEEEKDTSLDTLCGMTDEEYDDLILRDWRKASKDDISTMVYSEPDDAARVICALLKR